MHQICNTKSASNFANTSIAHFLPYIVMYLVKEFVTATAFQDTFIVKYCLFTTSFASCTQPFHDR